MAGTPRKTAMAGVDGNGALRGLSGQGERPARKTAGDVGKSAYVRKSCDVSPENLPMRKNTDGGSKGSQRTASDHDGDE